MCPKSFWPLCWGSNSLLNQCVYKHSVEKRIVWTGPCKNSHWWAFSAVQCHHRLCSGDKWICGGHVNIPTCCLLFWFSGVVLEPRRLAAGRLQDALVSQDVHRWSKPLQGSSCQAATQFSCLFVPVKIAWSEERRIICRNGSFLINCLWRWAVGFLFQRVLIVNEISGYPR